MPPLAQRKVTGLADQIGALQIQLNTVEKELLAWYRKATCRSALRRSRVSHRLGNRVGRLGERARTLPLRSAVRGLVGPDTAAELQCGKERLGRISRMGDRYLRRLLVVGMTSLIRRAKTTPTSVDPRLPALLQRKPVRVVTVAAANRTARVAWAIMTRGGTYRAPAARAA